MTQENIVNDQMIERAMCHLISLLDIEYEYLLNNKINDLAKTQENKRGVLRFLDSQAPILEQLIQRNELFDHISKERCALLKQLATKMNDSMKKVSAALNSKSYVNKKVIEAIQLAIKEHGPQNPNYKVRGRHVRNRAGNLHLVMDESV